jgi:hypothetical protein
LPKIRFSLGELLSQLIFQWVVGQRHPTTTAIPRKQGDDPNDQSATDDTNDEIEQRTHNS